MTQTPTQEDREAANALLVGQKVGGGDGQTYVLRTPSYEETLQAFMRHRLAAEARAKPAAVSLPITDETGWLIELPLTASRGGRLCWVAFSQDGSIARWQTISDDEDWSVKERVNPLRFTPDSNEALRFARKQDADEFIRVFDRFLLHAVATEHAWGDYTSAKPATVDVEAAAWMYERNGDVRITPYRQEAEPGWTETPLYTEAAIAAAEARGRAEEHFREQRCPACGVRYQYIADVDEHIAAIAQGDHRHAD